MKNLKTIVTLGLSAAFLLMFALFGYCGEAARVDAGSTLNLTDIATVSVTNLYNSKNEDVLGSAEFYYGDKFDVALYWLFQDDTEDTKVFSSEDVITYQLPEAITFDDITDPQPITKEGQEVGTYTVVGNVISIQYTSEEYMAGTLRDSSMSLAGKITSIPGQGTPDGPVEITFPGATAITITMHPLPTYSDMEIHNRLYDTNTFSADGSLRYYTNVDTVTSHGANTNIQFDIYMYPGMQYVSDLGFYSDKDCTQLIDYSRIQIEQASAGDNNIRVSISSMSPEETIYVKSKVGVDVQLYDKDKAFDRIKQIDTGKEYGDYEGRVPNRARVISDETIAYDATLLASSGGSRQGYRTSWSDAITLRGVCNKWANPNENKDGYLSWEIAVYSIYGDNFQNGYIIDTIPDNTDFIKDNIKVVKNTDNIELTNAITVEDYEDAVDGNGNRHKRVKLNFNSNLMTYLSESTENSVTISYYTKIKSQSEASEKYSNSAEIWYNGERSVSSADSMYYDKHDPLNKVGEYSSSKAPNVDYGIIVNPDSFDLDPSSDTLTLVDKMDSSLDFVKGSVMINKVKVSENDYKYDPVARTLTFELEDSKAYLIEYLATVNLVPGGTFGTDEGGNSATLSGKSMKDIEVKSKLQGTILSNSASASSTLFGKLNVIKHDSASESDVLAGAKFSLTPMNIDANRVVEVDSSNQVLTGTTQSSGDVSFAGLLRGKVYMLVEEEAPQGYVKNTELSFYVFNTKGLSEGNITYEGKEYKLNLISSSKLSYDIKYPNTKEVTTPNQDTSQTTPTTPNQDTSQTTPTTPNQDTTTTGGSAQVVPEEKPNTTEVPAMGTTNTEQPKETEVKKDTEVKKETEVKKNDTPKNDSSTTKEVTPNKENTPSNDTTPNKPVEQKTSLIKTGDNSMLFGVIILMLVSFAAIVGLVAYKRKKGNE